MVDSIINRDLAKLTEEVLASFRREEGMQRIGEAFLPSRARIVDVLDRVQQLLFPGYYGRKELTEENLRFHVGNLLMMVGKDLAETGGTAGKRLPKFDLEKADVLARLAIPSVHLKLRKSALAGGGFFCIVWLFGF